VKKTLLSMLVATLAVTGFSPIAQAGLVTDTIAINFGADEPNGTNGGTLAANAVAGVPGVDTANWNNTTGNNGTFNNLVRDTNGVAGTTSASVTWTSGNTWSSTGRGEENNNFTGANKTLLTGYLDNSPGNPTRVTISGLPANFVAAGYNVYIYALGGVADRGGLYTVNGFNKSGTTGGTNFNGPAFVQDPGTDHSSRGNYLVFTGLSGTTITIISDANFGGTPRSPINAIEIVANPEPATLALAGVGIVGLIGYACKRRKPSA
jgi:PEP-CTERM motif